MSLIRFYYRTDLPRLHRSVLGQLLQLKPKWSSFEVKGCLTRCLGGSSVCVVKKPHSAALMKSTLWCIDLACGLIDAVFKNSLVWGMWELQGGRRSCRAHLSMFTEPATFSQQQNRGLTGTPRTQWGTLSLYQMHKTHAQSRKVKKVANILHVSMHIHMYLLLLLIA